MKLSRALSAFLPSSSSQAGECLLLRAAAALQAASMSTGAKAKPAPRKGARTDGRNPAGAEFTTQPGPPKKEEFNGSPLHPRTKVDEEAAPQLPKPPEIPWQAKVANTVHLIGHLGTPVQLGVSPDGAYTAVSVLLHEKTHDLPQFWIPIVFQGDLAQIAACNLKEKDHVYVNGQLTGGSQLIDSNPDTKMQVMVHSISYVLDLHSQDHIRNNKGLVNTSAQVKDAPAPAVMQVWNDLFANPLKWWDYRPKDNKRSGAFKHKDSGQLLEIKEDTPEWILSQLDKLIFTSRTSSINFQSVK
ncbi:hypothetical protein Taro_041711 [Colocasia esculenta]|uniref:Uncharacterized protein n=1 Tax=Colocasia esculenta TaxID=4460 RepID=A0A843WC59_COLES|nr:hypothetical protein [Colocasia esculenta]